MLTNRFYSYLIFLILLCFFYQASADDCRGEVVFDQIGGYDEGCLECNMMIPGCQSCTRETLETMEFEYFKCTKCYDGFYLLQNATRSYDDEYEFAICVPDCPTVNSQYINDYVHGVCQDCGTNCMDCNLKTGCQDCEGSGYGFSPINQKHSKQGIELPEKSFAAAVDAFYQCHPCTYRRICSDCVGEYSDDEETCTDCYFGLTPAQCQEYEFVPGTNLPVGEGGEYLLFEFYTPNAGDFNNLFNNAITDYKFYYDIPGDFLAYCSDNCLECIDDVTCLVCDDYYYLLEDPPSSGEYVCEKIQDDTVLHQSCNSYDGTDCWGCIGGFFDGTECVTNCPAGSYGQRMFDDGQLVPVSYCSGSCDASCLTCSGGGTTDCTSCDTSAKYLLLNSLSTNRGQCLPKSSGAFTPADLYVIPDAIADPSSATGTLVDPYDNLLDAIERAYELAAPYTSAQVTIHIGKGDNFLVRGARNFYQPLAIDRNSQNLDLTIQPQYCPGSATYCSNAGDMAVFVYNKMRGFFHIDISRSLTITEINFDSTDSTFIYNSDEVAFQDSCQSAVGHCCTEGAASPGSIDPDDLILYCEIGGMEPEYLSLPDENCYTQRGTSVLRFTQSDYTTLSASSVPQKLVIEDSKFSNFLYEFNTFIELNDWSSVVEITDTTFKRFSNCGSIIRNSKKFFGDYDINGASIFEDIGLDTRREELLRRSEGIVQFVYNHFGSSASSPYGAAACTTDHNSATTPCFSIDITGSAFTDFGYLKNYDYYSSNSPPMVSPDSGMLHYGLVLSLEDFLGPVTIIDSEFRRNSIYYDGYCESSSTFFTPTEDRLEIIENQQFSQMRNILSIRNTPFQITIVDNTFDSNDVVKGVVYLESEHRETAVLIADNTFTYNFAYFSAIGVFIRAFTESGKSSIDIISSDVDSETDLQCGRYYIYDNNFTQNMGCPIYGGSVVQFDCVEDTKLEDGHFSANDTSYFNTFGDIVEENLSANIITYLNKFLQERNDFQTIAPTISESITANGNTYTVYTHFTRFEDNTYSKNAGSGAMGIVSISGLQFPYMVSEEFIQNEDSTPDLIEDLFVIIRKQDYDSEGAEDINTGELEGLQTIVFMENVMCPRFETIDFDGDSVLSQPLWFDDFTTITSAIKILNSRGPLEMSDVTIQNIENLESQSVISFEGSVFTKLTFNRMTFENIDLSADPDYEWNPLTSAFLIYMDSLSVMLVYLFDTEDVPSGTSLFYQTSQFAADIVQLNGITIRDVTCVQCYFFLIAFCANDFSLIDMTLENVREQDDKLAFNVESAQSSIFGYMHIPDPAVDTLTLWAGTSTLNNVYGSVLIVYFEDFTTNEYTYTIQNVQLREFYQTLPFAGFLSFYSSIVYGQQKVVVQDLDVDGIKIYISDSPADNDDNNYLYTGAIFSAYGLLSLTFVNNNIANVRSVSGIQSSGDVIFYTQEFDIHSTITISGNTIIEEDSYTGTFNDVFWYTDDEDDDFSSLTWGAVGIDIFDGSSTIVSNNNYYQNSHYKQYGGFLAVSGNFLNTVTFTDTGSTYSQGQGMYGAFMTLYILTSVVIQDCTFTESIGYGGAIDVFYSTLVIQDSTFVKTRSISTAGALSIGEGVDFTGISLTFEECFVQFATDAYDQDLIAGGVIYVANNAKVTLYTITATGTVDDYVDDTNSYGGFMYQEQGAEVLISDSTITGFSMYEIGAVFYIGENGLLQLSDTTFDDIHTFSMGGVFYADTNSEVEVSECTFTNIYDFEQGGLAMLNFAILSFSKIAVSSVYNEAGSSQDSTGGIIMVKYFSQATYTSLEDTFSSNSLYIAVSDSTFRGIYGIEKGAFAFIQSYSLVVENTLFEDISTSEVGEGALLYVEEFDGATYHLSQNTFLRIHSYEAAFVDKSACTGSEIRTFLNNDFEEIYSSGGTTLGEFNTEGCNFTFAINTFQTIYSNLTGTTDVGDDPAFKFVDLNYLEMENNVIQDILTDSNEYESFILVESRDVQVDFTFSYNKVVCQKTYNNSTDASMAGFMAIQGGDSFTSKSNSFKFCSTGFFGIYSLSQVIKVSDSGSTYTNNSASTGGIYYILASSWKQSRISIQDCTYKHNYGQTGGVFSLYNFFFLELFQSKFEHNTAEQGSIFNIQLITTIEKNSYMVIAQNNFYNSSASDSGGIASIAHPMLEANFYKNRYRHNYGNQGGIFYITDCALLQLSREQYNYTNGEFGRIVYSIANDMEFIITATDVLWEDFDESLHEKYVEEDGYNSSSSFYFTGAGTDITSSYNTFTNNNLCKKGGVFQLSQVIFSDLNSTFTYSSALVGGVMSCQECVIFLEDSSFISNYAKFGGVIYMESESELYIENATFRFNEAKQSAGCIFVTTRSQFSIEDTLFEFNYADSESVISAFMTSDLYEFKIANSVFQNNAANNNTVSFKQSMGVIQDSAFYDNTAVYYSGNIFLSFSLVTMQNVHFIDQLPQDPYQALSTKETQGQYIFVSLGVNLLAQNCVFYNGISSQGGAIFLNGLSTLRIEDAEFYNNYALQNGGAIYGTSYSLLSVEDAYFEDNYAGQLGSELYTLFSSYEAILSNVEIHNSSHATAIYCDSVSITMQKVHIEGNSGMAGKGGGLVCLNCHYIYLEGIVFKDLSAEKGGAIYIEQADSVKVSPKEFTYELHDSTIENSYSYLGGGLYINNPEKMSITGTRFEGNSVYNHSDWTISGYGGGLYYTCTSGYLCEVSIQDSNEFFDNYAANAGGGIKWDDLEPDFDGSNNFTDNFAELYGDDIGSFSQNLVSIDEETFNSSTRMGRVLYDRHGKKLRVLAEDQSTQKLIEGQQSGAQIPNIFIALADKYGNIVGNDISAKLTVRVDITYNTDDLSSLTYSPVLNGNSSFTAIGGVFNASDISFTGSPGFSYKIVFQTDGIDTSKPSNQAYLASSSQSNTTTADFQTYIGLRECEVGEAFLDSGKCQQCENGTQYLLVQLTQPGNCETCPEGEAICYGGSRVGPMPGHWRKNATTHTFISCPNPEACLGIMAPEYNPKGECAEAYEGVLCSMCEVGYSKTGNFECGLCPEKTTNIVRLGLIGVAAVIAVVYLVRSTLNGAKDEKNVTSIYLKIIMNHFQLILLTASFDFEWPQQVEDFFAISEPVSEISSQIFSVDCFLDMRDANATETAEEIETDDSMFNVFYIKIIMMALLPFLIFLACYAIWYIIGSVKRDLSNTKSRAISSLVIILFLVHPDIVQYMFSVFNCYDVDGELRVFDNMAIICYEGFFSIFAYGVGIPGIVIWGLGIPFFAYILLTQVRSKLHLLATREKFGFLYRGYKKQFYYWESVIMYRKIILIFIQVFVQAYGVISQALIVFILLICFLLVNTKKKPFVSLALNDLETYSLAASMITIYCGLFFISDMKDSQESGAAQLVLSEAVKMLFFVVIVFVNLVFFIFWGYKMYQEMKQMLIIKYGKVYLILCLCLNRRKLALAQKAALLAQENEFLREDYMKIVKNLKKIYNNGDIFINRLAIEKLEIYLSTQNIKALLRQDQEVVDEAKKKRLSRVQNAKDIQSGWKQGQLLQELGKDEPAKSHHLQEKFKQQFLLDVNMEEMGVQDELINMDSKRNLSDFEHQVIADNFTDQPDNQQMQENEDFDFLQIDINSPDPLTSKMRRSSEQHKQTSKHTNTQSDFLKEFHLKCQGQPDSLQNVFYHDEMRSDERTVDPLHLIKESNDLVIKKKIQKPKVDKESIKPKKGYEKMRKKRPIEILHSQQDLALEDDDIQIFGARFEPNSVLHKESKRDFSMLKKNTLMRQQEDDEEIEHAMDEFKQDLLEAPQPENNFEDSSPDTTLKNHSQIGMMNFNASGQNLSGGASQAQLMRKSFDGRT